MPLDPSIYQILTPPKVDNPADLFREAQQMRVQRETAEAIAEQRKSQAEERALQSDKLRRDAQKEAEGGAALDELFSTYKPGQPMPTGPVSKLYRTYGPEKASAIVKGIADFQTADLTTADGMRKSMLTRIAGLKALPEDRRPDAYNAVVTDYVNKGVVKPQEVAPWSPTVLDDYEKQLMTPEQRATNARADAMQAATLPGVVADSTVKQQVAAGTVGGITPEQQATAARANATAAESKRHNLAEEANAAGSTPNLTPDAIALTAHQYAMTGQLPPMGMGKQAAALRTQIINKAADIYKGLDLPSQMAAYKANQASLGKMQQQRDAIGAFEDTALKNLDQFLSTAQKVVDTGSPLLNKPVRSFAESAMGNPQMAAFDTARRTVIPEFAKILNNPNLSGQLSDSARGEVEGLLKGDATLPQILAVAKILKQDTANRRDSLDDAIKGIQQRIATPPGGTAPASQSVSAPQQKPIPGIPGGVAELRDGKWIRIK